MQIRSDRNPVSSARAPANHSDGAPPPPPPPPEGGLGGVAGADVTVSVALVLVTLPTALVAVTV
jgi:hypothetical protein